MNRQKILKGLSALSGWRESVFILALAQRAFPNLLLYAENVEELYPQDNESVEVLMDKSWALIVQDAQEEELVEVLDQVLVPVVQLEGNEQYGAIATSECIALWEQALLCRINQERKRALQAGQISVENVTRFIEFSEGEGLTEEQLIKLFDSHPLLEREFSFQAELSDLLRAASHPGDKLIHSIRDLAIDEGVSNIGISLR